MTVTLTTSPEAQRAALATIPLPTSYVDNGKFLYSRQNGGTSVPEMVARLRTALIEPSLAARFDALGALDLPKPPALTGPRLNQTPAQFIDRVYAECTYVTFRQHARHLIATERDAMIRELRVSMLAEVDSYLDQLRAPFDAAIGELRRVLDLGLTVHSTAENAMELGGEAPDAWMTMVRHGGSAAVLTGIASVRITLSTCLGIQPCNQDGDVPVPVRYGQAFNVDGPIFDKLSGWQRWLAIASTGSARLLSIAELDAKIAGRKRAARTPLRSPTDDGPAEPDSADDAASWQF